MSRSPSSLPFDKEVLAQTMITGLEQAPEAMDFLDHTMPIGLEVHQTHRYGGREEGLWIERSHSNSHIAVRAIVSFEKQEGIGFAAASNHPTRKLYRFLTHLQPKEPAQEVPLAGLMVHVSTMDSTATERKVVVNLITMPADLEDLKKILTQLKTWEINASASAGLDANYSSHVLEMLGAQEGKDLPLITVGIYGKDYQPHSKIPLLAEALHQHHILSNPNALLRLVATANQMIIEPEILASRSLENGHPELPLR